METPTLSHLENQIHEQKNTYKSSMKSYVRDEVSKFVTLELTNPVSSVENGVRSAKEAIAAILNILAVRTEGSIEPWMSRSKFFGSADIECRMEGTLAVLTYTYCINLPDEAGEQFQSEYVVNTDDYVQLRPVSKSVSAEDSGSKQHITASAEDKNSYQDNSGYSPRQKQKQYICKVLSDIWQTGATSTRLTALLERAAAYHKCRLQNLADDQIEEWLRRESNAIEEMCRDSALNG